MRAAQIDEQRIAYSQVGGGPALVLLHGGVDDSRAGRVQQDGLADEFTVIAWDAPGCGRSSEPPGGWRMAEYADCLADWLAVIGVDRPHVLGLSGGGSGPPALSPRHPE